MNYYNRLFSVASTRGFEPPTYRLGGGRSILLSYRRIWSCGRANASPPGIRCAERSAEQNLDAGEFISPEQIKEMGTQTG